MCGKDQTRLKPGLMLAIGAFVWMAATPHEFFGMACIQCPNQAGMAVPERGYSPPSPHEETPGMSAMSNCRQCHVSRQVAAPFVPTIAYAND
ncbi:MAG: hypothetical protein ACYTHJ_08900 [Planctomycetota bacterium]|jgi:hypothetical protein